ncbi:hypothetical protein [Mangrovimonas sp. YM274]|uniref:hypothetical protein n=1 Tax=Mangrovimonas sp. YM274 TaxID=3070660 RepID=UPI0027DBB59A|nr:hypothetical protein [Mangrovimonas sp. YM274]WMI70041.1 hypothetical protein RBH95_06750 [Mangrovimonas sp. YM274]
MDDKKLLKEILETTIDFLSNSVESVWSPLSPEEVIKNLKKQIENLKYDRPIDKILLGVEFAPTSTIQEISIANNWTKEFLKLSAEFDDLIKKI